MIGPVVVDIAGKELTQEDTRRIAHPLAGMVILFARNYDNPGQLKSLTTAIHSVKPGVLIAVDQEGGRVQRFENGFVKIPPMGDFGDLYRTDPRAAIRGAFAAGFILAGELRSAGVDLSFAPCVDVDFGHSSIIGRRAFSSDPDAVTVLALALTSGFAKAGMASCAKHFPGHGFVRADSHLELPVDERPLEALQDCDLVPYRTLAGRFESVMMAHVAYPAFDSLPASFSAKWIGFLRDRLGFTGAIFSDDLSMKGASGLGTSLEKSRKALAAGCDVLILCNHPEETDKVLEGLAWERTMAFAARTAALAPRGLFPDRSRFEASGEYLAARRAFEAFLCAKERL